jgi:uncharacterized membrane protein YphA (DoxX/SURF4 family)
MLETKTEERKEATEGRRESNNEYKIVVNERRGASFDAYQILRFAFTIAPIIAGIDKFFNALTNWEKYLSTPFDVFGNPSTTMMVVGIIEIIAGIGVWLKPKFFSYIVAAWLLGIIINLLVLQNYYDIALRDLGLLLGAVALGRLSQRYDI